MKDYKIDPYTQDYEISGGQFALTEDIGNNIYLSLMVQRGSWPFAPGFGSRLHLLMREKAIDRMERVAKEYCDEALRWLMDKGRAERIDVVTALDKENMRMKCLIEASQKGREITYEHFVRVR